MLRSRNIGEGMQRAKIYIGIDKGLTFATYLRDGGLVVANPVIPEGGTLPEVAFLDGLGEPSAIQIYPVARGVVSSSSIDYRTTRLSRGLYALRLHVEDIQHCEYFYYGDADKGLIETRERLILAGRDLATKDYVMPLVRRIDTLLQAPVGEREVKDGKRKAVYLIREAETITTHILEGSNDYRFSPGLHIRGFTSKIDGQEQYYRIFFPISNGKAQNGVPLVVMVPTTTSSLRPFIDSVFVARQTEADRMAAIAQEQGVAVLWMGYRCQPYGNLEEYTHFDEVLAAVERDYPIDKSRICLMARQRQTHCLGNVNYTSLLGSKAW